MKIPSYKEFTQGDILVAKDGTEYEIAYIESINDYAEFYIYGRYSDGYIYPLISMGYATLKETLILQSTYKALKEFDSDLEDLLDEDS